MQQYCDLAKGPKNKPRSDRHGLLALLLSALDEKAQHAAASCAEGGDDESISAPVISTGTSLSPGRGGGSGGGGDSGRVSGHAAAAAAVATAVAGVAVTQGAATAGTTRTASGAPPMPV